MRFLKLTLFVFLTTLGATSASAQAYLERYIDDVAQAVEQCTIHFPDMRATQRAMRSIGMSREDEVGPQTIYTKHGTKVIAIIERRSRDARCIFGVDGLRESNADAVLRNLVAANSGKVVGQLDARNYQEMATAYAVEMKGRTWFVGITKLVRFGQAYRGSLFVMRELEH